MVSVAEHYDLLIENGNDPLNDCTELRQYMDKWDGQLFIELLNLNRKSKCLEIGCGTGRVLQKLESNFESYTGIDISPKTIEKAKYHFKYENVSFICDDFLICKFSQTFNVIFSTLTFMHIDNKQEAINKAYSLLDDNGRFVLSIDKNQNKILDTGYSKIKIFPDTKCKTQNMLEHVGFNKIKCMETELAFIFTANK